jgi:glutathione S-transferase
MKLYTSPTTPFGRKVMIALHETGLIGQVTIATVATTPIATDPTLAAANPLGKIPCLERPEGPAIYDSRVILRYLDSMHAGRKLYPEGPALFSALTLEALGDGILDAGVSARYEVAVRPEDKRWPAWVEGQTGKIVRALDALESLWTAHLAGPLDAGAISVAAALGYLDFRYGDMGWREGRPRLAAWHAEFAKRPSYAATQPA